MNLVEIELKCACTHTHACTKCISNTAIKVPLFMLVKVCDILEAATQMAAKRRSRIIATQLGIYKLW